MATVDPPARTREQALAWESKQRNLAGIAAIVSGLLIIAGNVVGAITLKDQPSITLADGLRDSLGQVLASGEPGLLTERLRYFTDHSTGLYAQAIIGTISTALVTLVLGYLYRATEARRPIPRVALYLALLGPIVSSLAPLVYRIGLDHNATDYLDSGKLSTVGAHDVFTNGAVGAAGVLLIFNLLTAAAFVLISLNAMRAGLLSKFLGILGIITGAIVVLGSLGGGNSSPVIIEFFWLVAVGLLILGRLPNTPPAWAAGEAIPWPSRQELIERQDAAKRRDAPEEEDEPEEDAPSTPSLSKATPAPKPRAHSSSQKKKRKRR